MATYVIGDVHGCYRELQGLLGLVDYQPTNDQLIFVGDLVNRGPDSLAVLQFIQQQNSIVVLGNHDIFTMALGYGLIANKSTSLTALLAAPNKLDLLDWLRQQQLAYLHENYFIVHAGIIPQWTVSQALEYAAEVTIVLRAPDFCKLLDSVEGIYGNEPRCWSTELTGMARLRFIVNVFTRLRFCDQAGCLDLAVTEAAHPDDNMQPWFNFYSGEQNIIFGHWASLEGRCEHPRVFAIDTACIWGGALSALRLEDGQVFSYPAVSR